MNNLTAIILSIIGSIVIGGIIGILNAYIFDKEFKRLAKNKNEGLHDAIIQQRILLHHLLTIINRR